MTTLLVIDDDPYTQLIVAAAVPRDWSVVGVTMTGWA